MEQRVPSEEVWLTPAETARRIGISVRALRLYEDHGLIAPRRTGKEWRLYGARELARLNEVLILKGFGLSLSRIADLVKGRPVDLDDLLAVQRETLLDARERAERGLRVIDAARATLAAGEAIGIDELTTLARETAMAEPGNDQRAWRRYEQSRPRTEIQFDPARYADYVGQYQFHDGPFVFVVHEGTRFCIRILGQPNADIVPEAADRFFSKTMPMQVIFDRDADHRVVSFTLHQNGAETIALRADAETVRQFEETLRQRIRDRTPVPESETIMRRIVDTHLAGTPDYHRMTPVLAAIARDSAESIKVDLLGPAGPLQAMTFKGVDSIGRDVYDVRFEHLATEWGFGLSPTGTIFSIFIRPTV